MNLRNFVISLDAFPKVDVSYLNPTTSGGLTSIVAFTIIGMLTATEVFRYLFVPSVSYSLQVDRDLQSEISLRFDISIATPCDQLVVGVMDAGGQKELLNHLVKPEPVVWRFPDARANVKDAA